MEKLQILIKFKEFIKESLFFFKFDVIKKNT